MSLGLFPGLDLVYQMKGCEQIKKEESKDDDARINNDTWPDKCDVGASGQQRWSYLTSGITKDSFVEDRYCRLLATIDIG